MPIVSLSQSLIPTLPCPIGKLRIEYCDRELPGLLLEVRPSGASTFHLRYKADGKTKYVKIGTSATITLADARKKARSLKAEIELGADPRADAKTKKEVPTLDALWGQYEAYAKPRKRSFKRDEQLYRIRIQGKFGKLRLNQITRQQIQTFHTALLNEGLSPASCDLHLALLKRMFNLSRDWGMLDAANPVSRVPMFRVDNKVECYLDEPELERLLTVLHTDENRPVCQIVLFLLSTGCRLNEALSATWSQLDRANRVWRIPAHNSKSKKAKSVPLNDSALDILAQLDTAGKFEHVFVNKAEGKGYTTITRVWHRLRKKAALPHLRLHDLRHTHASMLIAAGRTLYEVQAILGHSNPVITQRYAHLSSKTLQEASNSASAIIKGAMQTKVKEAA